MNNIKVLETGMINKIAAGEVVERPLSIVKELAENSIDAGASNISVEIKDGGISYIRLTDNGIGIPAEQVRTAFLRHATSKISTIGDLESVMTMGFRGEALSSVAAVAQMEMTTKTSVAKAGTRIAINGGEVISENETGAADGTDIIVRNLFYNVPARRKFLKKPATESGYISDIITKLALGNADIAFKYVNNGTTILQTKGNGDLKTVIFQIYGKEVASNIIALNYDKSGVKLSGYLGKPSVSRGNRSYSLTYINGRYIKSEIIQSAVEDAYKTKLMQNKFPLYVLMLDIDPSTVDVNVHPTKLEVRFSDEDLIYKNIYAAVNTALKSESLIPSAVVKQEKQKPVFEPDDYALEAETAPNISEFIYDTLPRSAERTHTVVLSDSIDDDEPSKLPFIEPPVFTERPSVVEPGQQPSAELPSANTFFKDYRIVGQVFNTYWLVEQDSTVYLIDQHAAHERVLYEKLISGLRSKNSASQRLLQPIIIPVSQIERELIKENISFFEKCGFDVEEFDQKSFVLYAVPFVLGKPSGAGFFVEILDKLGAIENVYDAKIDAIATISCKAAVKANDRLSHSEARGLIEQILTLEDPFTCPHGRPTVVELSKTELEKMFKRIQP